MIDGAIPANAEGPIQGSARHATAILAATVLVVWLLAVAYGAG